MDCELVEILAIKECPELEDVYNLEVENTHNFAVNGGFIIHNCRYASEELSKPRGGFQQIRTTGL